VLVPLGVGLAGTASCSAPAKGALVLAISTDMQTPKDVDVISVFITSDSAVKFDYVGRVLPQGSIALPATLAVVQPDDPNAQIRIRVTAFLEQTPRVVRDVLTTVPQGRTTLLRLPLSFLDEGDVSGMLPAASLPGTSAGGLTAPNGDSDFEAIDDVMPTTCSFVDDMTSVNGKCVPQDVKSSDLPDYTQAAVYGDGGIEPNGAPVSCFDVQSCFASATQVAGLSMSQCSFPLPAGADPATYNLALVTPTTGACIGSQCYVPLVEDATDGWSLSGNTVQLLEGVCKKMTTTGALLFQSRGTCPTQTLADAVCEPVLGATEGDAGAVATDGGASTDATGAADSGVGCPEGQVLCKGTCASVDACGSGVLPDASAPSDASVGARDAAQ
jgi:hypothetical protein